MKYFKSGIFNIIIVDTHSGFIDNSDMFGLHQKIEYIGWNVKHNPKTIIKSSIKETIRTYIEPHYHYWFSIYLLLKRNFPYDVMKPIMEIIEQHSSHFEYLKGYVELLHEIRIDNNIETITYRHVGQSLFRFLAMNMYGKETIGIIKRYFITKETIIAEIFINNISRMMVIYNATQTSSHIIQKRAECGYYGKGFPALPLSLNMIVNIV